MDLEGKIAVITGAGLEKGFGRAIALEFAKNGANIVISDVCEPDENFADVVLGTWQGLEKVAGEIRELGREALAVKCDVTKEDEVREMVRQTIEKFGKIDILVNNAGWVKVLSVLETDEITFSKHLDVMAKGTFLCSKAVAPHMIERGEGGRIINISSAAGKRGWPLISAYTAAKFAIVGLTYVMGVEWGPHKITVNAVCPGPVTTDLGEVFLGGYAKAAGITLEQQVQSFSETFVPIRRFSTQQEIAKLCAFLASPAADTITCQAINVSGGQEQS